MRNLWLLAALLVAVMAGWFAASYFAEPRPEVRPEYEGQDHRVGVRVTGDPLADEPGASMRIEAMAARARPEGDERDLVETGHETAHLYEMDRVVWYCEGCPEGATVTIEDPHVVDLELAVDVALSINRLRDHLKPFLAQALDRCVDFEDDPVGCREGLGFVLETLGGVDPFRLGPYEIGQPVGEPLPAVGGRLGPQDAHRFVKFTWVIEHPDWREPMRLDPHIHIHPPAPGG